jgi:hypothetical protein
MPYDYREQNDMVILLPYILFHSINVIIDN